jgi:2-polyprenyl-3-methyl-5-hydroxy-6-metoxy-1,4-benzoquinol methylase
MSLMSGERQVFEKLHKIRHDHTARYYWTKKFIKRGDVVLDALCGVGYGSYIMGETLLPKLIVAYDGDEETIEYAKKHYQLPNIQFSCHDYEEMKWHPKIFDEVVCFEGIEHVEKPDILLSEFHIGLKDDGYLLLSTPNGRVLPWNGKEFPEHKCHFLPEELEEMMDEAGFRVEKWFSQHYKMSMMMNNDLEGKFMLCVGRKK